MPTIYVGNVGPEVCENDLEALFERRAPVRRVEINKKHSRTFDDPAFPGFAFIDISCDSDEDHGDTRLSKCLAYDRCLCKNSRIRVSVARRPKNWYLQSRSREKMTEEDGGISKEGLEDEGRKEEEPEYPRHRIPETFLPVLTDMPTTSSEDYEELSEGRLIEERKRSQGTFQARNNRRRVLPTCLLKERRPKV
ncbi:RNA recognition motif-containing protein [Giardia muris]|uniref:RNA recognition motif-containing protein n=1 Tax=Giardia muris TaxID=5742 RepID=A0A4Z1SVB3_GIAMU|nr:RNA recognition motif-containing protein [Giardia muris]|eukprot:TNJ27528.1 RNA recognition motif-containing protein [Giardia muris]